MLKVLKILAKFFIYSFAVIGFVLTVGFFAVKWGLTTSMAVVDKNNDDYQKFSQELADAGLLKLEKDYLSGTSSAFNLAELEERINELNNASSELADIKQRRFAELCKLYVISDKAPENTKYLFKEYMSPDYSPWRLEQMILAVALRFKSDESFIEQLEVCNNLSTGSLKEEDLAKKLENTNSENIFPWAKGESWDTVTKAILKDEVVIKRAASELEISPRLIVSILVVEQLRLYNTQREYFEKFFKPLEILANANKMAWGVMAIKEKAAIDIENHLKNRNSSFYPGEKYEKLLDFQTDNIEKERYDRLTNSKDHYYSYLYGGVLVKELISQWQKAGFNIESRPEVIATLFNIGFTRSKPKADPQVGGSTMSIDEYDYTFGSLAHEFYYSGLLEQFPY